MAGEGGDDGAFSADDRAVLSAATSASRRSRSAVYGRDGRGYDYDRDRDYDIDDRDRRRRRRRSTERDPQKEVPDKGSRRRDRAEGNFFMGIACVAFSLLLCMGMNRKK